MKKHESTNLVAPRSYVTKEMRERRQPHKGLVFWLTGLSGAGKSTLAHNVELQLFERDYNIIVLDGDIIRKGLCDDLGFSEEDRAENNRRVAELAKVFAANGAICLCAFISPAIEARKEARRIIGDEFFREIFISCSPAECERRDVKGFYKKARLGQIKNYTGVSAGYETPKEPSLVIRTDSCTIEEGTAQLLEFVCAQTRK